MSGIPSAKDALARGQITIPLVFLAEDNRSLFDACVICTKNVGFANRARLGSVFLVIFLETE